MRGTDSSSSAITGDPININRADLASHKWQESRVGLHLYGAQSKAVHATAFGLLKKRQGFRVLLPRIIDESQIVRDRPWHQRASAVVGDGERMRHRLHAVDGVAKVGSIASRNSSPD